MLCGEQGPCMQPVQQGPREGWEVKILLLSGDAEEGRDANRAWFSPGSNAVTPCGLWSINPPVTQTAAS